MRLFFVPLLNELSNFESSYWLNHASNVQAINSGQNLNIIAQMLKKFPKTLKVETTSRTHNLFKVCDPQVIDRLAKLMNQLLLAAEPNDFSSETEMDEHQLTIVENNLTMNNYFQQLVNDVVDMACREIVNEDGEISPVIQKLFLSKITAELFDKKLARNYFIKSYINKLIWPSLVNAWGDKQEYQHDMIRKLGNMRFAQRIFASLQCVVMEGALPDTVLKLEKAIFKIKIEESYRTRINESDVPSLLNTIFEVIVAADAEIHKNDTARKPSLGSPLADTFSTWYGKILTASAPILSIVAPSLQPDNFQQTLTGLLKVAYDQELKKIIAGADNYMKGRFDLFRDSSLDGKLHDIKYYGIPLATNFETSCDQYLASIDENNNFKLKYFDDTYAPFDKDIITYLSYYLHNNMVVQNSFEQSLSAEQYANFFSKKIILFAMAQLLNEQGMLRQQVIECFINNNPEQKLDSHFKAQLIYGYARAMFFAVIQLWLSNKKFQEAFDESEATLNNFDTIVESVKNNLLLGVGKKFLKHLDSFPIFGNKSAIKKFVVPAIANDSNDTEFVGKVKKLKMRFDIINFARLAHQELRRSHQQERMSLEAELMEIHLKLQTQNTALAQYSKKFSNIQAEISHSLSINKSLQTTSVTFDVAGLIKLDEEFTKLEKSFLISSTLELKKAGHAFSQSRANFKAQAAGVITASSGLLARLNYVITNLPLIHSVVSFWVDKQTFLKDIGTTTAESVDQVLHERLRYVLREKFFPRKLSYNNWDNLLENERSTILTSYQSWEAAISNIKQVCDGLKNGSFENLIANNAKQLSALIKDSVDNISQQVKNITRAAQEIKRVSQPLLTAINATRNDMEEVYSMLVFILDESRLWNNCVPYFGGTNYQVGRHCAKAPGRIVAMKLVRNQQDMTADPDFKIDVMLNAFMATKPGYGWRYHPTTEFYKHITALVEVRQHNFYNMGAIARIKTGLRDYMRTVGEPNYQMHTRYQAMQQKRLAQSPDHQMRQAVNVVTHAFEAVRRYIK